MKYKCSPIVQNIPFWTIKSLIKTEDVISCHTPSNLKAYQPHINLLIFTNISSCKLFVKYLPSDFLTQFFESQITFQGAA